MGEGEGEEVGGGDGEGEGRFSSYYAFKQENKKLHGAYQSQYTPNANMAADLYPFRCMLISLTGLVRKC